MREKSYVSAVALRPWTTPSGTPPTRSATAERNSPTTPSALRWLTVAAPRCDSGPVSVRAIASPTTAGVWVPPGLSKWAMPEASEGNSARKAETSKGMQARDRDAQLAMCTTASPEFTSGASVRPMTMPSRLA